MDSRFQPSSALYVGHVRHTRLRPFVHAFTYRVFALLIDLDELPALDRRLRLFSHNRRNVLSFMDRDHGPRDGTPLRPWIEERLAFDGIDITGGRVRLLCMPRVLGYVFNPLSVWFCHDRDGGLRAILYEVSNTFGERHGYLLPVLPGDETGGTVRQRTAKSFYVSPFLPPQGRYGFRVEVPGERLRLAIRLQDALGPLLAASQTGRRRPLNDASLTAALAYAPALTWKVIAVIHWQALRLWLKGALVHRRPKAHRERGRAHRAAARNGEPAP